MKPITRYETGLAAERTVARRYLRAGYTFSAHRHRSPAGEIDLVMRNQEMFVFIEVKSSSTHAKAAEALGPSQQQRIAAAADHYLGLQPNGQLADARFDVALVDRQGVIKVIENVMAA